MRISNLIIGLLLVSGMITGLFLFVNNLSGADGYNVAVEDDYQKHFNKTINLSNEISEQYYIKQNWTGSKSETIGIITMTIDALSLVKNIIVLPFAILSDFAGSLQSILGLPRWVFSFFIATVTVLILFGFIAIVLRYKYT